MSRTINVKLPAKCARMIFSKNDRKAIEQVDLLRMLFLMHLVREFETTVLSLQDAGLVHGPVHVSIGQEAIAAGSAIVLRKSDQVGSTHRAHGHFLSKAVIFYGPDEFNPLNDDITRNMQTVLNKTLAEIMGLKSGWCGGRGGSMHLYDGTSGNLGSNAIVGGGIPIATGAAWAQKMRAKNGVVVSFFGDGAINQGCFHEVANMASLWGVPILYFLENNYYAVGTSICESSSCENLGLRSLSYGIDSLIIDGMDPVAVHMAVKQVVTKMRKNPKPFMIEAETYRFSHHAGRLPGSLFGYRSKEEEAQWLARDPLVVFPEELEAANIIDANANTAIKEKVKQSIEIAVSMVTIEKNGKRRIPASKWPQPDTLVQDVRSDPEALNELHFSERQDFTDFKDMTYVEAIAGVTHYNLERDHTVFVCGEEVGHLSGGPYGATRGIQDAFPERTINTPISECGFVGMAGGAAMVGMKPVVEIMFPDFSLVAADQLFNQIGKLRHMYGGQATFPLVVRTRVAIGYGYGGQHSMNPAGFFGLFSGWRVMAPSDAFDYVGMFNTAMQIEDPVLIIEHADLYARDGFVPTDTLGYCIAYGRARKVRDGTALTVLTYLTGVHDCMKVAEELEADNISIEIIDLRTLDYGGIDYGTIGVSIKKTGRVLIVEQTPRSLGISGRLSDEIQERFFDCLYTPVEKVVAVDVPPPVSKALEDSMFPSISDIRSKILQIASRASSRSGSPLPSRSIKSIVNATPLARNLATLHDIALEEIKGSGPRGKIYSNDILNNISELAKTDLQQQVEDHLGRNRIIIPVSNIRGIIAKRLSFSKFSAPHAYFFIEVDMEPMLDFKHQITASSQEKTDIRISINDIMIKAVALMLRDFPLLNASLGDNIIKLWQDANIGLAVTLNEGLIVPAIVGADRLQLQEIAIQRYDLVTRARAGKLKLDEIERGTFTISSLANTDITHFTAIINPPQSGILSVGPTLDKPVVDAGQIKVGKKTKLGLSVDHRIVDGTMAADFLSALKDFLENITLRL